MAAADLTEGPVTGAPQLCARGARAGPVRGAKKGLGRPPPIGPPPGAPCKPSQG